ARQIDTVAFDRDDPVRTNDILSTDRDFPRDIVGWTELADHAIPGANAKGRHGVYVPYRRLGPDRQSDALRGDDSHLGVIAGPSPAPARRRVVFVLVPAGIERVNQPCR